MQLNYKQWQARNTKIFKSLNKQRQQELRNLGYCNVSWAKVKKSWEIVCGETDRVISIFDRQLKNDNLLGAIASSILESERAKNIAQTGILSLKLGSQKMTNITNTILAKYQTV
jgi:CRISPR/Cas system CMR subunit Cmr6 (Cas7 group RAMP superfamily)